MLGPPSDRPITVNDDFRIPDQVTIWPSKSRTKKKCIWATLLNMNRLPAWRLHIDDNSMLHFTSKHLRSATGTAMYIC